MSGGEIIADKKAASTSPSPNAPSEEPESEAALPDESSDEDARFVASAATASSADKVGTK